MKTIKGLAIIALTTTSLSLLLLAGACSNAGKGDSKDGSKVAVDGGGSAGADADKLSRIVISLNDKWTNLSGYVVGDAAHASLQKIADQNGKPGFLNMEDGVYDIVLEGQETGADGKLSPVALRVSGVTIRDGINAQIRDVELKPYVNLIGSIKIAGESAQAGILVKVPGTTLAAATAADGSFSLSAPAGSHSFEVTSPGFARGFIGTRAYRADEHLPTITLVKDSHHLDTGAHYLGEALVMNGAQKISIHLVAPTNMTYFRYAVAEDINKKPWLVLQSSIELDQPAGANPEVSIQYSLDQRQLSPIYAPTIPTQP